MADLALDIILFCILTRLETKHVLTCKAMCKEWDEMISTPEFQADHYSRTYIRTKQKTLLIHERNYSVYPMNLENNTYGPETIIPFPFNYGLKDVEILAHMDGVLCVCLKETNELVLWNPTTTIYNHLSNKEGYGIYFDKQCTVGLYKSHGNDYKLLHITQTTTFIDASVYSRNSGTWRQIPFQTKVDYVKPTFHFSPGTFCDDTLYFTVCECWVIGQNVVLAFDTVTEDITEIPFPPVPSAGIFQGHLANVQNTLQMVLTTGIQTMSLEIWALQEGKWVSIFSAPPIPPIPLSVWSDITHYMTNGTWFAMRGTRKIYEIPNENKTLDCFYPVSWFRGHRGMVYIESIISPTN